MIGNAPGFAFAFYYHGATQVFRDYVAYAWVCGNRCAIGERLFCSFRVLCLLHLIFSNFPTRFVQKARCEVDIRYEVRVL